MDHEVEDGTDLEWVPPTPASIGTLLNGLPEPMPPSTLKHTWRESFGAREGFGAPSAGRRRRRTRRVLRVLVSVVVLLSALTAVGVVAFDAVKDARHDSRVRAKASMDATSRGGARTRVGGNKEESKRDVAVRDCSISDNGFSAADLVVTNHSTETADYVVSVEFDNGYGRRAGTGYVTVSDVDPGATSGILRASSYKPAPSTGLACHVGQVTRLTY